MTIPVNLPVFVLIVRMFTINCDTNEIQGSLLKSLPKKKISKGNSSEV